MAVVCATARPAYGQAKESFYFYNGVEAMLLGDLQKSGEIFKIIIKENPMHAPSYYYLGRIALAVGQVEPAYDVIRRAIQIDSSNTTYLNTYVQVLISRKEYVEAEKLIAKLRQLEPNNAINYQIGAALLLEIGDPLEARKLCELYENQFGIDEKMIDIQRTAYIQTENYYQAESFLRRVVAAYPQDVDKLLSLADMNAALMHDSTALALYDEAIELDSTLLAPRLAKANYFQIQKQTTQYIEALIPIFKGNMMPSQQKIEIFEQNFFSPEPYRESFALVTKLITALVLSDSQNIDVRMLYGRFLSYSGQVDAAIEQYQALIAQKVDHPELVERLLQIYFYQNKYDIALELSTSAYQLQPTSQLMEYRTLAAWLGDDPKLALKLIDQAVKTYKTDSVRSVFYALQGDIYERVGESAKSYKSYEKSLKINPDNAAVLNNYAYHLSIAGKQLDRALVMAQKANKLSPDNPTYLDTEAWVLFRLGRYIDAQILMRRVIALDGRPSAEVLLHYGDILYELGDDFLARNYWKKAAEAGAKAEDIEGRVLREKAKRPVQ